MGTDKIINRTAYCCTRLNVSSSIAEQLNRLIELKDYDSAIGLIKSLGLSTRSEELLTKCVESYKHSC
jgi:hypothetical protein